MMCTGTCQCKSCENILAEVNYGPNCNKEDANNNDFDDAYEDKTYWLNRCLGSSI